MRASRLADGIDLDTEDKEYNPAEVLIESDESDVSDLSDSEESPDVRTTLVCQTRAEDILDKLCEPCVGSKSTRVVRRNKTMTATTDKLEEVHADLWGPHDPPSQSGSSYAAILMCEHTRKTWTLYLQGKDDFVDAFQAWLPRVETESNCSMKVLRADGGGEFISAKLRTFCERRGIAIKYAAPYMHEENGLAERGWRTIVTMKDSMLIDSGLPNGFWAEAMETANYLRNRLPTKSRNHGEMIPEESWTGQRQNLQHVRIFGSLVLSNIPEEKRTKSDYQRVWQGILIGYSPDTTKHFRVWAPQTKQVVIASEPYIDESEKGAKLLVKWPLDPTQPKRKAPAGEPRPRGRPRKNPSVVTHEEPPSETTIRADNNIEEQEVAMSLTEANSKIHEPKSYDEAIDDPIHGRRWREAIEEELQNLESHQTWEYDELPPGRKAIGSKWVFKVKYHPDGSVARFKARLVAQGFSQVQGIDFSETFAPPVRRESLRIYLALCLMLNLFIHQVDIVGAYLESLLSDNELPIFMKLPPGIRDLRQVRERLMCRLLRSLYGLKQSGRLWNQNVIAFYKSIGFIQLNGDPSILIRRADDEISIVSVYVDDFLLASNTMATLNALKASLAREYDTKDLDEVETIIGWQIHRDHAAGTLKIDQSAFVRDLVLEEGLTDCNANVIPMKAGSAIDMSDPEDYEEVDLHTYQRLIGKLMYLSCGTRPDIAFAVGQLSRHNADPRKGHLRAAKRVVRYLKGTIEMGLTFGQESGERPPRDPLPYGLVGYADSNFAGDPEDRKSVMGYCFFLNGAVVSWSSKKQRTVSTSTTEAEYIALGHAAREAVWIRRFINEMNLEAVENLTLYGDNEMSIALTKNAESQHRTKHIDVQHHYIRELVNEKELTIKWIPGSSMLADGMTKALPTETFRKHRALLGLTTG